MSSHIKSKDVAKIIEILGPNLEKTVLQTMKTISDIVGATLGPGGRPILIERQEYGLGHVISKDGVTVFRSLGFDNPNMHAIMETARDAATRTVQEAGDGTTTATVLAEAIVRHTSDFCKKNPKISPQKVVRKLESVFKDYIEPQIKKWAIKPTEKMLLDVAALSANGDRDLAKAVMECFDAIGDDGNVNLVEMNGPSHYEVEIIKGFPINMGLEDSCGKFLTLFTNDKANNRCYMEKPVFVLYYGAITELQTILHIIQKVGRAWKEPEPGVKPFNHNLVIVATGFSETVLGTLAMNFMNPETINVFPLLTPKSFVQNGEMYFLHDLAAVVGAKVFDPVSNPVQEAELADLGHGIDSFEASRYRSTILGLSDENLLICRADEVKQAIATAESKLEASLLQERLAKITGGVAKLKVIGSSTGELREKRDRAEDAICAVRGARKNGCLPGGGWTLKMLIDGLRDDSSPIVGEVLIPSLMEPIQRIFQNCGFNDEEIADAISKIEGNNVFDAWEGKQVNAIDGGVLDSIPAVLSAIQNSLSIASLLGTLGGTIVFKRDHEMELAEAREANLVEQTCEPQ